MERDQLMERAMSLARNIADQPPVAVRMAKKKALTWPPKVALWPGCILNRLSLFTVVAPRIKKKLSRLFFEKENQCFW